MSAEDFNEWLAVMKKNGIAKTDAQCAQLLGITANGLLKRKKQGAGRETALACAALLNGINPFGY